MYIIYTGKGRRINDSVPDLMWGRIESSMKSLWVADAVPSTAEWSASHFA
jgi:hypothetical protein